MSYIPPMANAKPSDQAKALRAFADELERTGRTLPTDVLEELAVLVAEDTPAPTRSWRSS